MFCLDLDSVDELHKTCTFFGTRRWHPLRFRREDYLGDHSETLKQSVIKQVCDMGHNGQDIGSTHKHPDVMPGPAKTGTPVETGPVP